MAARTPPTRSVRELQLPAEPTAPPAAAWLPDPPAPERRGGGAGARGSPCPRRRAARVRRPDARLRPEHQAHPHRPRPRAAQTAAEKLQFQLWLVLGGFAVLLVIHGVPGFQKNNAAQPKIEGANERWSTPPPWRATSSRRTPRTSTRGSCSRTSPTTRPTGPRRSSTLQVGAAFVIRRASRRSWTWRALLQPRGPDDAVEKFRAALRH